MTEAICRDQYGNEYTRTDWIQVHWHDRVDVGFPLYPDYTADSCGRQVYDDGDDIPEDARYNPSDGIYCDWFELYGKPYAVDCISSYVGRNWGYLHFDSSHYEHFADRRMRTPDGCVVLTEFDISPYTCTDLMWAEWSNDESKIRLYIPVT